MKRFIGLLSENQRATFAGSMASAWLSLRLQVKSRFDLMPIRGRPGGRQTRST